MHSRRVFPEESNERPQEPLVFLAPMSGVTDLPFRQLARELGAPMVVSEMVASEDLVQQRGDVARRTRLENDGVRIIQLAGREAKWMSEGARIAESLGADVIDINMGCPSRQVTGKLSGSALMRDLDHAVELIRAVVSSVAVPVTVKMRLGWDDHQRNAAELARRAEAEGVELLTVHGRTRCQFFKGDADWAAVRTVTDATRLPVIVNGDIGSIADAVKALKVSGAAGVMVGRGAYGRPWLPGRIAAFLKTGSDPGEPGRQVQNEIAVQHVERILSFYGSAYGIRNARKHIGWYLESCGAAPDTVKSWRKLLCTSHSPSSVLRGLSQFYDEAGLVAA